MAVLPLAPGFLGMASPMPREAARSLSSRLRLAEPKQEASSHSADQFTAAVLSVRTALLLLGGA